MKLHFCEHLKEEQNYKGKMEVVVMKQHYGVTKKGQEVLKRSHSRLRFWQLVLELKTRRWNSKSVML